MSTDRSLLDAVQREIIVVIDATMMPDGMKDAFTSANELLEWSWVRTRNGVKETYEHSGEPLMRPIEPSRWLKRPPKWSQE